MSGNGDGLVLTHGAGASAKAPLLIAVAEVFAGRGVWVLRCDLPFRQLRAFGPPGRYDAERDRQGLRKALTELRMLASGRIFLGGHSYGGRQATILASEEPGVADALLLFSYPLHPPKKPQELRTSHFGNLRTPALFVHGTEDPFGSVEEMEQALALIPAKTELVIVDKAGHELRQGKFDIAKSVAERFIRIASA